jgi:hypothetical protein
VTVFGSVASGGVTTRFGSGYIATGTDREGLAGFTAFIREHNRLVAEDTRYVAASSRFGTA